MINWKRNNTIKNFIPAIIVLALVVVSLKNYSPKAFAPKVKEERKVEETTTGIVADMGHTKKTTTDENSTANSDSKVLPVNLPDVINHEDFTYKDGDFYGEAQGFRGMIQVCVTIKNGKIKSINIIKSQDDEAYFNKAISLTTKIANNQTTNVDTVSGATYSSKGIIGAVRNALEKAGVKKQSISSKVNKKNSKKKIKKGKIPYKDGVYYGTGEGFKGEIKVAVVIENKKIQYILIMESEDDKEYFNKAKSVVNNVIKYQKTSVDTVSGATYSSKGILNAIKNALKNAKEQTNKKPSNEADDSNNTEQETTTVYMPETGNNVYKDGTYTLTGICNPDHGGAFEGYTLSATITIKNDRVVGITDVKGIGSTYIKANDWYLNRAIKGTSKEKGVVNQILSKGNAESIDTVSGATCSSQALIEIVKKALENAKN